MASHTLDSSCSNYQLMTAFSKNEFEIASFLPVITAMFPAICLVIYTNFQVDLFAKAKERVQSLQFISSYNAIVKCLPFYSGILVTSLICSSVWFHLPLQIFELNEKTRKELQVYGDEMTLFLGITYTLTVLFAIATPILRLIMLKGYDITLTWS